MTTYHDSNPNFQPFQPLPQQSPVGNGAVPPIPPSNRQASYRAGEGMYALMEFKRKCEGIWLGWVAYKAGTAYYEMHPDAADAAIHGAHALRRWWIWLFFFKVWLGSLAFLGWLTYVHTKNEVGDPATGLNSMMARIMIWIIPATVAIAIMYTRNIDFALFKRRWFYWLLRPVAIVVEWVPNWLLYVIVFLPLCSPWPMAG